MKYLLIFFIAVSITSCEQSANSNKTSITEQTTQTKAAAIGKVFEYGIYDAQRKGRVRDDLNTNTGKIVTKPVLKLSETTNRIPLIKNTYFAYRYRLLNLPKEEVKKPTVELRKVLIHPTMTLPDGSTSTGWDRIVRGRTSISQVIAFDGYVFNEDYELVEGEWIFQIWFKDLKLVEQTFTTYKPENSKVELTTVSQPEKNNI